MTAIAEGPRLLRSRDATVTTTAVPVIAPPARRYLSAQSPWTSVDFTRLAVLGALGTIAVGACWYGGSGGTLLADQEGWLVGAVAGAAVSGVAMLSFLVVGFREVRRGQRNIVLDLADRYGWTLEDGDDAADVIALPPGTRVVAAGMTRMHRPDCLAVHGKAVVRITEEEVALRGLLGCGLCASSETVLSVPGSAR